MLEKHYKNNTVKPFLAQKWIKALVAERVFLYDVAMQLLLNLSKYLMFVILSFSLIFVWDGGNTKILDVAPINTDESTAAKPDDSFWSSLGDELLLDHKAQSSQVQAEIRKLLADQSKLYQILKAAGPYIYFIHSQTQARGLPAELALIPIIESEFNPNDHSKKGALGLWQLMPQTAHELGVRIKSGYDGRRNVIASTRAALAYFFDLGTMFNGNWYLAIAAYNCGQGRIASAERRAGSKNFWNLRLPQETKIYVPKLLAVAEIVKNPEKYGVQLPPMTNAPFFTELKLKKTVTLEQIAKSSGINIKILRTLNPDYTRKITPKKGSDSLLVPINKAPAVRVQLADKIAAN